MPSFLEEYFQYVEHTEPPKIFHLWSALAGISALAGRNIWWKNGPMVIYPNIYVLLIGSPGTRKSTAIKIFKRLMKKTGYNTFSADRSTKQKFLMDLENGFDFDSQQRADAEFIKKEKEHTHTRVSKLLAGTLDQMIDSMEAQRKEGPSEVFVAADEFMDFFGMGNMEFAALLGVLWDKEDAYTDRLKNSKSVYIPEPTVSILGGATHENFKMMFPPELLGQGFMSRLLMIYGESSGKKFTFLEEEKDETTDVLVKRLLAMRKHKIGNLAFSTEAKEALDGIYKTWHDLQDARFRYYSTRRFTQLIKLLLILATEKQAECLDKADVVFANTLLTHAELYMPKAMGEYGKSKNSEVSHKIIDILEHAVPKALTIKEIWTQVAMDMDKFSDLLPLLQGLMQADKIQKNPLGEGFLPKKEVKTNSAAMKWVDFKLLEPFGLGQF